MRLNKNKREREQLIAFTTEQLYYAAKFWAQRDLAAFHRVPGHGFVLITHRRTRYIATVDQCGLPDKPQIYLTFRYYDCFNCYVRLTMSLEEAIYNGELQVCQNPKYLSDDGIPINATHDFLRQRTPSEQLLLDQGRGDRAMAGAG